MRRNAVCLLAPTLHLCRGEVPDKHNFNSSRRNCRLFCCRARLSTLWSLIAGRLGNCALDMGKGKTLRRPLARQRMCRGSFVIDRTSHWNKRLNCVSIDSVITIGRLATPVSLIYHPWRASERASTQRAVGVVIVICASVSGGPTHCDPVGREASGRFYQLMFTSLFPRASYLLQLH